MRHTTNCPRCNHELKLDNMGVYGVLSCYCGYEEVTTPGGGRLDGILTLGISINMIRLELLALTMTSKGWVTKLQGTSLTVIGHPQRDNKLREYLRGLAVALGSSVVYGIQMVDNYGQPVGPHQHGTFHHDEKNIVTTSTIYRNRRDAFKTIATGLGV